MCRLYLYRCQFMGMCLHIQRCKAARTCGAHAIVFIHNLQKIIYCQLYCMTSSLFGIFIHAKIHHLYIVHCSCLYIIYHGRVPLYSSLSHHVPCSLNTVSVRDITVTLILSHYPGLLLSAVLAAPLAAPHPGPA